VREPRARALLVRAIAGRGAFGASKDALFEFPDLRQAGRTLRRLFEWRNAADYAWLDSLDAASGDPVKEAERFVAAVAAWISAR
jgi:hypothetical protein